MDKFVDEYPMTVTGKIQRFKMRNVVIGELGLEEDAGIETAWSRYQSDLPVVMPRASAVFTSCPSGLTRLMPLMACLIFLQ